jgi:hypothetical protein
MDEQDWIPVIVRRRYSKKEAVQKGCAIIQQKDPQHSERIRMAKLEHSDTPLPKKRVNHETLQALIRKRIEMKLNQEKADSLCAFPKHTFKDIESNKLIPTEDQKRRILQNFGIQLKVDTVS